MGKAVINNPDISVVMAVYNGGQHLSMAIESILRQSYTNFEFIIIDDCSTDETPSILASYDDRRIIVVRNCVNLSQVPSLNIGLEQARGIYIARMDGDDISRHDRFSKQIALLHARPKVVAVGSDAEIIDLEGRVIGYEPTLTDAKAISISLAVYCPMFHPSVMMRREDTIRLGGYDFHTSEDTDLWGRFIAAGGELANIPEPLIQYRRNPSGLSVKRKTFYQTSRRELQNREWNRFGPKGPAPPSDWPLVWPSSIGVRPREHMLYGQLHLQFAKGYRRRRKISTAFRHWIASFYWIPTQSHSYFYALLFILPYPIFEVLEKHIEYIISRIGATRSQQAAASRTA